MTATSDTYLLSLSAVEVEALFQAASASPAAGFGPSDSGLPVVSALGKLAEVRKSIRDCGVGS